MAAPSLVAGSGVAAASASGAAGFDGSVPVSGGATSDAGASGVAEYLAPYDTAGGQLFLGLVLAIYAVLLLRDVGMRELEVNQANGAPVMPLLRRLSEEAVLFDDVMAAGETDEDVLLAVLSGQPPSPETPVMADPALPYLPGVARDLRDVGYETAFFDGSRDLRTYRQTYLRMAGG